MKNSMTLGNVVRSIPSNQHIIVRDYFDGVHYADGTAQEVIGKTLDYNQELRCTEVYKISIEGNNILCIEVLMDNAEVAR